MSAYKKCQDNHKFLQYPIIFLNSETDKAFGINHNIDKFNPENVIQ